MNVMGILFSDDGALGALTENRTMASLPFGGRYRLVDFALSNLCCAGIRRVGIIARQNYQSLMNHIGSGEEWGMEMEEGGLEYLTPYSSSKISEDRGKLESLYYAMRFLRKGREDDLVVLIDAATLCNLDLTEILEAHIQSGKDITIVTKKDIADGNRPLPLAVKLDKKGQVVDMVAEYAAPRGYEASIGIFVLSKTWLMAQVEAHIARNRYHLGRDLVLGLWQKQEATVHIFSYEGLVMYNHTVEEYFQNNLRLTEKNIREDLFSRKHPVYTKVRDRVPTYYGETGAVENCSVADGCILEGTVRNSVLFRQVHIKPGAQVENCVIMNDTVVGEDAKLRYGILDKDVVVRKGAKLMGTETNPVIIGRGGVV